MGSSSTCKHGLLLRELQLLVYITLAAALITQQLGTVTGVHGQLSCDGRQSGIANMDCVIAIKELAQDVFTLRPGHFMQEVYGTCRARVTNHGKLPKKFYQDSVTLGFADVLYECVRSKSHSGTVINGNNISYSLTRAHSHYN